MAHTIREIAIGPCPEMVLLSSCCVLSVWECKVGCRVMCTRYRGCMEVVVVVGERDQAADIKGVGGM